MQLNRPWLIDRRMILEFCELPQESRTYRAERSSTLFADKCLPISAPPLESQSRHLACFTWQAS